MRHRYCIPGAIIGAVMGLVIIIGLLQNGARTPQCVNFNNVDGVGYRCSFGFLNEFNSKISDIVSELWPHNARLYSVVSLLVILIGGGVPGTFIGCFLGRAYIELRKQNNL